MVNWLIPRGGAHSDLYDVIFEFDEELWLNVDLGSFMDRRVYLYGYYSKYIEYLMQGLLKEGCVAFDCGANIGMYTLKMAKSVGSEGRVISIEPHDIVRKKLEANISFNRLRDRITVIPCALSGSCGTTVFHYPPASDVNQGNASLYRKGDDWLEKEVEVKTIDKIAEELNLLRVDIIRCDVQGEELNLLKGAENVIRLYAPVICLRYDKNVAAAANLKIEELISYLHGLNYLAFINKNENFIRLLDDMLSVVDAELLFIQSS
jgi:methyltransferase, FkbM family